MASEYDSHADVVIFALRELGFFDVLRIDFEAAHGVLDITIRPQDGKFSIKDSLGFGRECSECDIKTIWWRRTTSSLSRTHLEIPRSDTLDAVETFWALRYLFDAFPPSSFPLGHPSSMISAANKLRQLKIAEEIGFSTPATIFSNDATELLTFASNHEELVVKPLKSVLVRDIERGYEVALPSSAVTQTRLKCLLETNAGSALFCQERLRKNFDVRLNVFPSRSIACRIDVSRLPNNEVDWRSTTFEHRHELIDTPDLIESRCRAFLAALDLPFGAFDFGLTDAGEWIFFECNPNGQWLWIEILTGAPLSRIVANQLLQHHAEAGELRHRN